MAPNIGPGRPAGGGARTFFKEAPRRTWSVSFDWESWWALELPGKPSDALRLLPQVRRHHAAFFRPAPLLIDFAYPATRSHLSRYRLVVPTRSPLIR